MRTCLCIYIYVRVYVCIHMHTNTYEYTFISLNLCICDEKTHYEISKTFSSRCASSLIVGYIQIPEILTAYLFEIGTRQPKTRAK